MEGRQRGKSQAQVLSYLGGGHVSLNCVVMEVSAYMVSCQSATLGPPTSRTVCRAPRLNAGRLLRR